MAPKRILLMVTADRSVSLVSGLALYLHERGWDVHVSSSPGTKSAQLSADPRITHHPLPMNRNISPVRDAISLIRASMLVRRIKPVVVSAGTPKAGLLGMLATRASRRTVGVYQLRGLRLETATGLQRRILTIMERIACRAADEILALSPSLKDRVADLGLAPAEKVAVVGSGSSNGVDLERFSPSAVGDAPAHPASPSDETPPVLGLVGRITADKGLSLLAASLRILAEKGRTGTLLVVGSDDSPESGTLRSALDASGWKIKHLGHVQQVERIYPHLDLLCMPSKREGFGNVILEAAAACVPTVATSSTGIVDAIVDGKTGRLVADRNPRTYAAAIDELLADDRRRQEMGRRAHDWVQEHFAQEHVWSNYADYYDRLASSDGRDI